MKVIGLRSLVIGLSSSLASCLSGLLLGICSVGSCSAEASSTEANFAEASIDEQLKQAWAAHRAGRYAEAVRLATQAIEEQSDNATAHLIRAQGYAAERDHARAIVDCDRAIELDAALARAFYDRARSRFATGDVAGSLRDFQHYIKLQPDAKSRLWENGISLYYAGRYREGAEQFALYQEAYPDDVENAVWRYLCMARNEDDGTDKARREILPIKNDQRVPMMEIYALYRGDAEPHNVLAAARAGNPSAKQLNKQLFYAHLYLGLYYEAQGAGPLARKHLEIAAEKHKIGHYMWDVAVVGLKRLS